MDTIALQSDDWVLVRADALPDVYHRVLAVDADLSSGRITSVSEAVRLHGISRSAYYKYRGTVAPYVGKAAPTTMTVELLLQDCPGVLSCVLSAFAKAGANILTVNQNIPTDGVAPVSISFRMDRTVCSEDELTFSLKQMPGLVDLKMIHSR